MKNFAKYCKDKGMNIDEYTNACKTMRETCHIIIEHLEHKDDGMWRPFSDIFECDDKEMLEYWIQEFKKQGMEIVWDWEDDILVYRY